MDIINKWTSISIQQLVDTNSSGVFFFSRRMRIWFTFFLALSFTIIIVCNRYCSNAWLSLDERTIVCGVILVLLHLMIPINWWQKLHGTHLNWSKFIENMHVACWKSKMNEPHFDCNWDHANSDCAKKKKKYTSNSNQIENQRYYRGFI